MNIIVASHDFTQLLLEGEMPTSPVAIGTEVICTGPHPAVPAAIGGMCLCVEVAPHDSSRHFVDGTEDICTGPSPVASPAAIERQASPPASSTGVFVCNCCST